MDITDNIVYRNHFGIVTSEKIILNNLCEKKDIHIGQIRSIDIQRKRNYQFLVVDLAFGLFVLLLMLVNLNEITGIDNILILVAAFIALLSAFMNWIGSHHIIISTIGQSRKPLPVAGTKIRDGAQFVEEVKKAIFRFTVYP